jgi:hypothetical protein
MEVYGLLHASTIGADTAIVEDQTKMERPCASSRSTGLIINNNDHDVYDDYDDEFFVTFSK